MYEYLLGVGLNATSPCLNQVSKPANYKKPILWKIRVHCTRSLNIAKSIVAGDTLDDAFSFQATM